jgi:hypothetical protein
MGSADCDKDKIKVSEKDDYKEYDSDTAESEAMSVMCRKKVLRVDLAKAAVLVLLIAAKIILRPEESL